MFIKRAKSRPSIRARDIDDDELIQGSPIAQSSSAVGENEEPSIDMGVEASGSVMERKKAQRKGKLLAKSNKLSFGADEETSTAKPFQQRKSHLSLQLKSATPSTPSVTVASMSSPAYSREYLSELKASTPSRAPRMVANEEEDVDDSRLSRTAREKYASSVLEDSTAGIPDPAAIAAAKIKRQNAVGAQRIGLDPDEDFISLGGRIAVYDGDKGPHPESRLMREEDEDDDGDEDLADYTGANEKLYIGKDQNRAAARRLKGEIGELIADREADSDDDEDTKEWEQMLVSRAGQYVAEVQPTPAKQAYRAAPIPVVRPPPTISSAQSRLSTRMMELRSTKVENQQLLETAIKDLSLLEEQERDIKKQVEEVEAKREWVEEFQGWVEMLGSFLEEKYPILESIEEDSMQYHSERAEMVSKRRAADDADDLALFLGIPSAPANVVEAEELGKGPAFVDLSAPSSSSRQIRRTAREDRRARRRGFISALVDEDGLSTDGELDNEVADDYTAAQHDLTRRVHGLLEDVEAEDFRDPAKGLAIRFKEWRSRYPDEYSGAFGGLALVQAWEFWSRGEMVGWDPLRNNSRIKDFSWFTSLYDYSRLVNSSRSGQDDDMDLEPELGPDGDLTTEMVSKTVVSFMIEALKSGLFDPYSAPQTRRAIDLVDTIAELIGKDSRRYMLLLEAVVSVYHSHLLEISSFIASATAPSTVPPPPFDRSSRQAMQRYVRRRIKLLSNIVLWRNEAPKEVRELATRLVGEVLRPVLGRTWSRGGQEIAQEVFDASAGLISPDLSSFLKIGPRSW